MRPHHPGIPEQEQPHPKKPSMREQSVMPPTKRKADIIAVQAMMQGLASSEQQKRALDWIINQACQTYETPWRPGMDGDRATYVAIGRQMAGQFIVSALKTDVSKLPNEERQADPYEPGRGENG